jgi:hypothetical protein
VIASDDDPQGEGGEFLVLGTMEPVGSDHPAAAPIAESTAAPLAFFTLSVDEAVGTTYGGSERDPVYRSWRDGAA